MTIGTDSSQDTKVWIVLLSVILILGLYLRLETVRHTQVDTPVRADARDYTAYAYNLARHGVYSNDIQAALGDTAPPDPDALRSPGYPAFLSLLTSDKLSTFVTRTLYSQALISTITLVLIAYLGSMLMGKWPALAAVLLAAISPHLVVSNTFILTETLYAFGLFLTLLVLSRATISNQQGYWIAGAILLGLTTLIRPVTQYFIIFLALYIWFHADKQMRQRIIIIVTCVFLVIVSAWAIRNLLVIGQTSDPQLMINGLHHGMYPGFTYNNQPETYGFPYHHDPDSAQISVSVTSILLAILNRFLDEPATYIAWYLSKPAYFFQWELIQGIDIFAYPTLTSTYYAAGSIFDITHKFMQGIHPLLVIGSIFGMIISCIPQRYSLMTSKQRQIACLLSSVYVYMILVHIVVAPFPRYAIPLRPLTYLLAILGAYSVTLNIYTWYQSYRGINRYE